MSGGVRSSGGVGATRGAVVATPVASSNSSTTSTAADSDNSTTHQRKRKSVTTQLTTATTTASNATPTTAAATVPSAQRKKILPPVPNSFPTRTASNSSSSSVIVASAASPSLPSPAAFYHAFFLPLTFYRSLDDRWSGHGPSAPFCLRRNLQYGLNELNAERRKRRKMQQQILQRMKKKLKSRGDHTHLAVIRQQLLSSASNRPYIHIDELLPIHTALTTATASTSTSPLSTMYANHLISKKLSINLDQITFHKSKTISIAGHDSFSYYPPSSSTLHVTGDLYHDGHSTSSLCQPVDRRDSSSTASYTSATLNFATVNFFQHAAKPAYRNSGASTISSRQPPPSTSTDGWSLRFQLTSNAPKVPSARETVQDTLRDSTARLYHDEKPPSQRSKSNKSHSTSTSSSKAASATSTNDLSYLIRYSLAALSNSKISDEPQSVPVDICILPSTLNLSGQTPIVVGSAVLKLTWSYKQHPSTIDSIVPRPRSFRRQTITNPTLVTWRYTCTAIDPQAMATSATPNDPSAQCEYRPNFSCTFCSLQGDIHLHSFEELTRHLEASHSEYLSFQYRLPTTVPVASNSSSLTSSDSTLTVFDIIVSPQSSAPTLLPLIVAPQSDWTNLSSLPDLTHDSGWSASDWLTSLSGVNGVVKSLPKPFLDGLTLPPTLTTTHLSDDGRLDDYLIPSRVSFHHFGEKYSYQRLVEAREAFATNSLQSHADHHQLSTESKEDDMPSATTPTVKSLLEATQLSAKARSFKEELQKLKNLTPIKDATTSSTPTPPGGRSTPASRSRPQHRFDSSSANSLLYTRQWYHASTGTPLSLNELDYDSDEDVDEEWFIQQNGKLIDEFHDVSASEKAFMKLWNEFILRKGTGGRSGGGRGNELIYADYLFPNVCASFAKICAPLIRPYLRGSFLCHLLTSWEFGLLEYGHIEAIMRILDSTSDEYPIQAGEQYLSFHAPARGVAYQSARDACGGLTQPSRPLQTAQRKSRPPPPSDSPTTGFDESTPQTSVFAARKSASNWLPSGRKKKTTRRTKPSKRAHRPRTRSGDADPDAMDTGTSSSESEDDDDDDDGEEDEEDSGAEDGEDGEEESDQVHSSEDGDSDSDHEETLSPPKTTRQTRRQAQAAEEEAAADDEEADHAVSKPSAAIRKKRKLEASAFEPRITRHKSESAKSSAHQPNDDNDDDDEENEAKDVESPPKSTRSVASRKQSRGAIVPLETHSSPHSSGSVKKGPARYPLRDTKSIEPSAAPASESASSSDETDDGGWLRNSA